MRSIMHICVLEIYHFFKKEMANLISAPTFSRLVQDLVPPSSQGGKARKKREVRKLEENHSFYLGKSVLEFYYLRRQPPCVPSYHTLVGSRTKPTQRDLPILLAPRLLCKISGASPQAF